MNTKSSVSCLHVWRCWGWERFFILNSVIGTYVHATLVPLCMIVKSRYYLRCYSIMIVGVLCCKCSCIGDGLPNKTTMFVQTTMKLSTFNHVSQQVSPLFHKFRITLLTSILCVTEYKHLDLVWVALNTFLICITFVVRRQSINHRCSHSKTTSWPVYELLVKTELCTIVVKCTQGPN